MSAHSRPRHRPTLERMPRLRTRVPMETDKQSYILVAAIDFGTTYSGYAFSFTTETNNIRMNKNWAAGAFDSYKTPTCVLFEPNGSVHFGYEALKSYSEFDESEKKRTDLFKHFKMLLYGKEITKSMKIAATNGRKRRAVDVFAASLKFLKDHMIEAIVKTVVSNVDPNMIKWVITLPAIWSDEAKQFMREAALEAGCIPSRNSDQLVLALEPEVASIFCREIQVDPMATLAEPTALASFAVGTKYLVIDAGGGTVDITAHEVRNGGNMREILQPTGGPWGGTEVDKAFEELMKKVMTPGVVAGIQKHHDQQWLNFMINFEHGKKRIKDDDPNTDIKIEMSYDLCEAYRKFSGRSIIEGFPSKKTDPVFFTNGKLVISHKKCMELLEKPISHTVDHVRQLLRKPELQDIIYVLLVGGFGECPVLQRELENILPGGIKLIVPEEAQLAIIKGAVQYGLRQKVVESRPARKTYGIDIEPRFNEKDHDPKKRVMRQGVAYCNDVFLKFIDKGTVVKCDDICNQTLYARTDDQQSMSVDIYCTDKTDLRQVEYVSDGKFQRVGGLTVFMPDTKGGRDRKVEVQFKFGGTEIQVCAKDITSGQIAKTEVDMLLP